MLWPMLLQVFRPSFAAGLTSRPGLTSAILRLAGRKMVAGASCCTLPGMGFVVISARPGRLIITARTGRLLNTARPGLLTVTCP